MKKILFILALVVTVTANAQTTQQGAVDSVSVLIPDNNLKIATPARVRRAFNAVINYITSGLSMKQNTITAGSINLDKLQLSGAANGKVIKSSGTQWVIGDDNTAGSPTFAAITGVPSDNTALNNALNAKQNTIVAGSINLDKLQLSGAANGKVIKSSGTQWVIGDDNGTVEETPEKYGAVGDGITNDYNAFVSWLAANASGKIKIPAKTYKINGTLVISKNGNGVSKLEIDATGAKIVTDNASNVPILRFYQTKNLTVRGLEVQGLTDYDGLWLSDFYACKFQDVKFGFTNASTFDEFYWNSWNRCDFREIWINTGTALDKTEFNSNAFYNCNIWQGDYALRIYGSQLLQGFNFYSCDVSYQVISQLYVDEPVADGTLFFTGGYWDSDKGMPINTKGIIVNAIGVVTPNSANASTFTLKTGSQQNADVYSGVRNGSRLATSSVNLVKNGDLQFGVAGIYNSGMSVALTTGPGMFGKYLKCMSNTLKYIDFEAIAAPYSGTYSVTVIGRNNNNTVLVPVLVKNGIEVLYTPVKFRDVSVTDNSFVVSSANIDLVAGEVLKVRFYSQEGVSNDFDISYCGVTFGKMGVLYAPLHPLANVSGSVDLTGIGLKTTYAEIEVTNAATTLFSLPMGNYFRISSELTCYGADATFPDGATYSKHIITANRYEAEITSTLLPITATTKAGDITTAPAISLVDSGGGILQIKATATDGAINMKCKLEGRY